MIKDVNEAHAIYEVINPSDKITFRASNIKMAILCGLVIGQGNYGIRNTDSKTILPILAFGTQEMFDSFVNKVFEEEGIMDFALNNRSDFKDALNSWQCVSIKKRPSYEKSLMALPSEERIGFRMNFKEKSMTSMTDICGGAWNHAEKLRQYEEAFTV
jgi:hypothetical protein